MPQHGIDPWPDPYQGPVLPLYYRGEFGEGDGIRARGLHVGNVSLYQLSYTLKIVPLTSCGDPISLNRLQGEPWFVALPSYMQGRGMYGAALSGITPYIFWRAVTVTIRVRKVLETCMQPLHLRLTDTFTVYDDCSHMQPPE